MPRKKIKKSTVRVRTLPTPHGAKKVGVRMTKNKTYITWVIRKPRKKR